MSRARVFSADVFLVDAFLCSSKRSFRPFNLLSLLSFYLFVVSSKTKSPVVVTVHRLARDLKRSLFFYGKADLVR